MSPPPEAWAALITAIAGLVTSVAALVTAIRAHRKIDGR